MKKAAGPARRGQSSSIDVIGWLLEDDAPGVQYLTRLHLLGESPTARRMQMLRRRCNDYPPVARMLDRTDEAIAAGNYKKYQGAYWTLLFLADMVADGRDPRAQRLARHVLSTQLENGGFSASSSRQFEIVCLTGNELRALNHLGFGAHQAVQRGYERLADRILRHGGVPCIVMEYSIYPSCSMTLPQTLRCVAAAPDGVPRTRMTKLRDLLIRRMLDVRVYKYVRPDTAAYRQAVRHRAKGVREKDVAARWRARKPPTSKKLLDKPGWLRFGFPHSYNPDLLEAMLALTEAGASYHPAMKDALAHIESKRLPDGRWKLDESLDGKMLANVEARGRPSKWITLSAMRVLTHFGRIDSPRE